MVPARRVRPARLRRPRGRAVALLSLAALAGVWNPAPSFAQATYTARTVLVLGGPQLVGGFGEVAGLDDAGRMVGSRSAPWTNANMQGFVSGPDGVGVTWLPSLRGAAPYAPGEFTGARGINNQGVVVGSARDAAGRTQAFYSLGTSSGLVGLGFLPGGTSSVATAVNDAGWIAGRGTNARGLLEAFITGGPLGSGGLRGLGVLPGGTYSIATDLNAEGRVVGYGDNAAGQIEAFITGPNGSGGLTGLGFLLGGTESRAHAINDRGQVVGEARNAAGRREAFLTGPNGMGGLLGLGFLPGRDISVAYDVSPIGRVVGHGSAEYDPSHPYEVTVQAFVTGPDGAGGLQALDVDLAPGYDLAMALAINARGQIAAHAWPGDGRVAPGDAVLLTPSVPDPPPTTVPEPGTVALLAAGLLVVASMARRRR